MKELLRKGFLLGIGITELTTTKVKKEIHKYMKENNINKSEAEKYAKEFSKDIYGEYIKPKPLPIRVVLQLRRIIVDILRKI